MISVMKNQLKNALVFTALRSIAMLHKLKIKQNFAHKSLSAYFGVIFYCAE